jgi:hypothetical protein
MDQTVNLEELRQAIYEAGATWTAGETPLLRLSAEERRRRLGVVLDEADLARLRQAPAADLAGIMASLRIRPEVEGHAAAAALARQLLEQAGRLQEESATLADRFKILPCLFPWWPWRSVDWRNHFGLDAVTPVRDQGGCGSCVAFGTTAALESMLVIERNLTTDLSEAELLFCGGGSCGGWWPSSAVSYLETSGLAQESCFPYQDHDMACSTCSRRDGEAIKVTASTVLNDAGQRKAYLHNIGPVIAVFEVFDDFFGYTSGIYRHVTGGLAGLHCVEVIGYDDCSDFWICKNSWGSGWGEAGFFCIAYGQCGIDSTYPFWGISGTEFWK